LITTVKLYMSEDNLLVMLGVAYVLSQIAPFFNGNPHATSRLHQEYFIIISVKLQDHGHVVEMAIGERSREEAGRALTPE
jgi:hypothetical protein